MKAIDMDSHSDAKEHFRRPPRIDVLAAFMNEPEELDFIWSGFLTGSVGALVAPGATGKSFWALQAAMAVASGSPDGDLLKLSPRQEGRVLYRASEDPMPALVKRLNSFNAHFPESVQRNIARNLYMDSLMGFPFDIMSEKNFAELSDAAEGCRLVVFDTLSRVHQLDENSNGDMSRLIVRLEQLACRTGASVLFLHHVNKVSVREGQIDLQQAARGASALIDNARWCGNIVRMTEAEARTLSDQALGKTPVGIDRRPYYVRFGVSKQNYSAEYGDCWYERQNDGVLIPKSLRKAPVSKQKGRCRDEI